MTVVLHDANCIRLIGACPVDDGETLLQLLLANPMPRSTGEAAKALMPRSYRFFSSPNVPSRDPQPVPFSTILSVRRCRAEANKFELSLPCRRCENVEKSGSGYRPAAENACLINF